MDKNYASGWNELTTKNSWMLFKIMGEFVEGFEKMGLHNPCISIFGSARTPNTHNNYKLASEIAKRIVDLGFGTLDELMEAITLIQTSKIKKIPIILVGTSFWSGLIDWLKQTLLEQNKTINNEDLDLFSCVNTADEVIYLLKQYYSNTETGPNF